MSLTYATGTSAASAAAPPPRRKSCGRCVKAKRRCDLQLPCSRCAEKGLACEYPSAAGPWRPDQSQKPAAAPDLDLDLAALNAMGPDAFEGIIPGMNGYDLDLHMDLGDTPSLLTSSGAFDQVDDPRESSFGSPDSQSTSTRETFTREDYEDFYELREELDHGKLGNPNSASAYIIDMVRNFPKNMALKMKTPFLHPRMYEDIMPKAILDAFTASALYANKNSANEAAVFKVLDANASSLLQQHNPAEPKPARDLLIMIQALLLYQIIRLFDGDIRQRGHAETAMPALKEMTMQLEQHRDQFASVPSAGPDPPHWDSWLLEECTRRTVLVSHFFLSKYHLLRNGDVANVGPWGRAHRWTLSTHLWEASSSFEFTRAWKEKPHWTISNCFVKEVLHSGKGSDVDDLGRMYIVSYLGTDAAKRWYYETGSPFD